MGGALSQPQGNGAGFDPDPGGNLGKSVIPFIITIVIIVIIVICQSQAIHEWFGGHLKYHPVIQEVV